MTTNQIRYQELQEQKRANRVNEAENMRGHDLSYAGTVYKADSKLAGVRLATQENARHNRATEDETRRSNVERERQSRYKLGLETVQAVIPGFSSGNSIPTKIAGNYKGGYRYE